MPAPYPAPKTPAPYPPPKIPTPCPAPKTPAPYPALKTEGTSTIAPRHQVPYQHHIQDQHQHHIKTEGTSISYRGGDSDGSDLSYFSLGVEGTSCGILDVISGKRSCHKPGNRMNG
ncbi:hypothetical protein CEXT_11701 [Caerostris extrusa]|uniref:Uncharacterized protein n=1 Tax=Caerostris extrusa TaxID=172846 RepID=A0AAV4TSG4_CAEEX|nr:hypothetical protein CEXT_11701 [Caerostris extrusa]